jgi:uncharacterized protein YqgV (UPF0045/DUF77 family)
MQLVVEISLYPLVNEYIEPIKDFIERLNQDRNLSVNTSQTSTVIKGECDYVMQLMSKEMQTTYEQVGQAIFVCKFLNGDKMSQG